MSQAKKNSLLALSTAFIALGVVATNIMSVRWGGIALLIVGILFGGAVIGIAAADNKKSSKS